MNRSIRTKWGNRARRATDEIVTVDGELTRSLAVDRHHHVVGLAEGQLVVEREPERIEAGTEVGGDGGNPDVDLGSHPATSRLGLPFP